LGITAPVGFVLLASLGALCAGVAVIHYLQSRENDGRLAEAWDQGLDGSRGLGLIGIDLFAPNNLSLRFFTVGPFNE
jgi:hypothetical protein